MSSNENRGPAIRVKRPMPDYPEDDVSASPSKRFNTHPLSLTEAEAQVVQEDMGYVAGQKSAIFQREMGEGKKEGWNRPKKRKEKTERVENRGG